MEHCINCDDPAPDYHCTICEDPLCEACYLDYDGFCAVCLEEDEENQANDAVI